MKKRCTPVPLVLGNRFLNNKLGAVLSASYNNNDYGSDDMEATWAKDDAGNTWVEEAEVRTYNVQRIRRSGSLALDYQFNARNVIFANAMYNWRDDRENRFRLRYKDIEPAYDANGNITGYTGTVTRETKGGIENNRNKGRRLEDQRVQNYSLRGEHLLGSKVNMDWAAAFSTAKEDRPNERYVEYELEDQPLTLDLANPRFPMASAPGAANADYSLNAISENHDFTRENELGLKLNFRVPLSMVPGQKGRLRFGARLRLKDKKRENNYFEYEPLNELPAFGSAATSFAINSRYEPGAKYDNRGAFIRKEYLGSLKLNDGTLFEQKDEPKEYRLLTLRQKKPSPPVTCVSTRT
ncbi:hypothetical protein MKQ70_05125 [Chitinophaga sedimenti]|uniref:hypothetical protein n=1 Tax=Chitinophaga sedimenti TaxID=2033606 RepID=UPI002003574E|nr:hypothetical protein [Chitinophaga sedimenti]MCK7554418.1 hypothetical protein [Chitinophaga sedimenti]